jgi:hypothetical protein
VTQRALDLRVVVRCWPRAGHRPRVAESCGRVKVAQADRRGYPRLPVGVPGIGPALVLVDDVHWFDQDTVEVVRRCFVRAAAG